ncbi:T9SS type A sorting domain-containing protein, partial [Bacteroidota bacterium]
SVIPSSGWRLSGENIEIEAIPDSNYSFEEWTGSGPGSYTGNNNPAAIVMNGPIEEVASFSVNDLLVTLNTNPPGRGYTVDGTIYTTEQVFNWKTGSNHTISTTSPQSGETGVQYVWDSWNDGGNISHTVSPTVNTTYTANFDTKYYLMMIADTGGSVTPSSGWRQSGENVEIEAFPDSLHSFEEWTGSGPGSYTGNSNPATIVMNGPIEEVASFSVNDILVTVNTNPIERSYTVDGTTYTSEQVFNWQPGSNHTISTTSPQSGGTGIQYVWNSWNDGGNISHTISPMINTTYTADFDTEFYLTMKPGRRGSVEPSSGWRQNGENVEIEAFPDSTFRFEAWTGSGPGSYSGNSNPASIVMNGPIKELARFFVKDILITINTIPIGQNYTVDDTTYTAEQVFSWQPGSNHTISTTSPQSGGTGIQYVWNSWSDGGNISHTISPGINTTYTAIFNTDYYLTMTADTGGSVTPSNGWRQSGEDIEIGAFPDSTYSFEGWTGRGPGSYTGNSNPATIIMNGPIDEIANFLKIKEITILSPNGGEIWEIDNLYTVSWMSSNIDSINIKLSRNNGKNYDEWIANKIANNGEYSWTAIEPHSDSCIIKIIDASDDTVFDISDSLFSIITVTSLNDFLTNSPKEYKLYQNFPNPFNPTTNIFFSVPKASYVRISIYNLVGEQIDILLMEYKNSGNYNIHYDASHLSSGMYFLKMQASNYIDIKKMVLLK